MGIMRTVDRDTVLKAVMERYSGLTTLKLCLWEDEDTVLVNLLDDLNYGIDENELLDTIKDFLR
jgi:hypothetical protein